MSISMCPLHLKHAILLAAIVFLFTGPTQAAPIVERVFVSNAANVFRTGATGTGPFSGSSTNLQWFDTTNGVDRSSLAGGATVSVTDVDAIRANPTNDGRPLTIADLTFSNPDSTTAWNLDLGSNIMVSDVSGYKVDDVVFGLTDYGHNDTLERYDFRVGLWDGVTLRLATETQLNFLRIANPSGVVNGNTSSVVYLGNNRFQFRETDTSGTGTHLFISSAVAGQVVRTFSGFNLLDTPAVGDRADLFAVRNLSELEAPGVPEPSSALLIFVGGAAIYCCRRQNRG